MRAFGGALRVAGAEGGGTGLAIELATSAAPAVEFAQSCAGSGS